MSLRFPWQAGGIALWLAAGASLCAQTPPPGLPPGAPPTPATVTTNSYSNRPTRREGLRYLEEELSRALQFFSGKGSLDSILAPPPSQQALQSRTVISRPAKDDSDSGDSMNPLQNASDRQTGQADDTLKLRTSKDGRRQSLDELYRQMNQSRERKEALGSRLNTSPNSRALRNGLSDSNPDDNLPGGIREKERSLRDKLFGNDPPKDRIFNPDGVATTPGVVSGMFNPEERGLGREETRAHQDYLERYRQVLSGPTPAASPLSMTPGLPSTIPGTLSTLGGLGQTYNSGSAAGMSDPYGAPLRRNNSALSASDTGSMLAPPRLPDLQTKALNSWNPMYQTPAPEPPKPLAAQPVPFVDPPRRRF